VFWLWRLVVLAADAYLRVRGRETLGEARHKHALAQITKLERELGILGSLSDAEFDLEVAQALHTPLIECVNAPICPPETEHPHPVPAQPGPGFDSNTGAQIAGAFWRDYMARQNRRLSG
jgi:hypothetical protein